MDVEATLFEGSRRRLSFRPSLNQKTLLDVDFNATLVGLQQRRTKLSPSIEQKGGFFETCRKEDVGQMRKEEVLLGTSQGFCKRGMGTAVWARNGSDKGGFCCPWKEPWCGGCAMPNQHGDGCGRHRFQGCLKDRRSPLRGTIE